MKKVVLIALLLATAAASAQAYHEPQWGALYICDYSNYSGSAIDFGISYWLVTARYNPGGYPLIRTTETFQANTQSGWDTYKASWAIKPENGIVGPGNSTIWEFTFNPDGPQCRRTLVYPGSNYITFGQCSDGHSRVCWRY